MAGLSFSSNAGSQTVEMLIKAKLSDESARPTGLDLLQSLGYAFYLGWAFLMLWGPFSASRLGVIQSTVASARLFYIVTMALVFLLTLFLSKNLGQNIRQGFILFLAVALSLLVSALVLFGSMLFPKDSAETVAYFIWILGGMSSGLMLTSWSKTIIASGNTSQYTRLSIAFLIAGLIFLSVLLLQEIILWWVVAFLPILSAITLATYRFNDPQNDSATFITYEKAPLRETIRISKNGIAPFAIGCNIMSGFVCCRFSLVQGDVLAYPLLGLAWVLAGALVLVFGNVFISNMTKRFATILVALVGISIVLFCLLPTSYTAIFVVIMMGALSTGEITSFIGSSEDFKPSLPYPFGSFLFLRFTNTFFLAFGWFIGLKIAIIPVPSDISMLTASFIIFMVLAIGLFRYILSEITSERKSFEMVSDSYSEEKTALVATVSQQPPEYVALFSDFADAGQTEIDLHVVLRCMVNEYSLSRREADVLYYLARGRNAQYIHEKLFVSVATVRSHIYNIYLKLAVHSQQELMDVIEKKAAR